MIHEFAVDPEALAGWQNFRYLSEKFGVPHGRLISRFPKEWKRMVYEACNGCKDVEKKRIAASLERIDEKLLASGRSYDRSLSWIPNAVSSHAERPFRAIITNSAKANQPSLLDADSLNDDIEAWKVARAGTVARNTCSIAGAARTLLQCSSHIVLVDQHFSSAAKYGRPLAAMISYACLGSPLRQFEYHLGARATAEYFRNGLDEQRRHLELPSDLRFVFVRWRQLEDGDNLHPRYVLTERGGIRFDHGLDEGEDGETTDVECLDEAIYKERWSQYRPDAGRFDLVDAWIMTTRSVSKANWTGEQFEEV